MIKKITLILCSLFSINAQAQIDPLLLKEPQKDSSQKMLNMDAVYNRPFVAAGKLPVALGGYVEANWQHMGTDGISDGHQFQFRRMTLFVASTISKRIKFLSEIEFEPAEKEIAIEFAAVDIGLLTKTMTDLNGSLQTVRFRQRKCFLLPGAMQVLGYTEKSTVKTGCWVMNYTYQVDLTILLLKTGKTKLISLPQKTIRSALKN
jgi:hypothetical protein